MVLELGLEIFGSFTNTFNDKIGILQDLILMFDYQ